MSEVFKVADAVSAHCYSPDRKQIALCPNNEKILIYSNVEKKFSEWKLEHELSGHDLLVTSIDWSPVHNKIVSCSHDRNAFVWTFANKEWKPSLSILRINRAALHVKWSPDGKKFAVASGSKVVPVCHYEKQNDWWISKMIKKHKSTVLNVSWHPNSQLLATGSSDFRCRIFSAFIKDVDSGVDSVFGKTDSLAFGDLLAEFVNSNGWVEGVSWSPNGEKLAFVGHDSSLNIATVTSDKPTVVTLKSKQLPATRCLFLSDKVIVTVGHLFNPQVFQEKGKTWDFVGLAEEKKKDEKKTDNKQSGFSTARNMWANKTTKGQDSSASKSDSKIDTTHSNTITDINPYGDTQWSTQVDAFSTSGIDGQVVVWRARDMKKHLKVDL